MPLDYSKTTPKPRGFWVGLLLGTGIAVIANLIPYLLTYRAWESDGFEQIGFPLTFRFEGGEQYRYVFSTKALFGDIAIGFAIALIIAVVWRQWEAIRPTLLKVLRGKSRNR